MVIYLYIRFALKLQKRVPAQSRDNPAPVKKSREAPIQEIQSRRRDILEQIFQKLQ
jgi:hypothetical protein